MMINAEGHKTGHRFSWPDEVHARLTYDALEEYRTGADTDPPGGIDPDHLDHLLCVYPEV